MNKLELAKMIAQEREQVQIKYEQAKETDNNRIVDKFKENFMSFIKKNKENFEIINVLNKNKPTQIGHGYSKIELNSKHHFHEWIEQDWVEQIKQDKKIKKETYPDGLRIEMPIVIGDHWKLIYYKGQILSLQYGEINSQVVEKTKNMVSVLLLQNCPFLDFQREINNYIDELLTNENNKIEDKKEYINKVNGEE